MLEIFVWKKAAPQTLGKYLVLLNTITTIMQFTVTEDISQLIVFYIMYPTGLLPVATSCIPASLNQTLRFTASLELRSTELSTSTTVL